MADCVVFGVVGVVVFWLCGVYCCCSLWSEVAVYCVYIVHCRCCWWTVDGGHQCRLAPSALWAMLVQHLEVGELFVLFVIGLSVCIVMKHFPIIRGFH